MQSLSEQGHHDPTPSSAQHAAQDLRQVTRTFSVEEKGVARLEFVSVEDAESRSGIGADLVSGLRDEIAELEEKLHQQTEAAHKQVEEARLLARLLARKEWERDLQQRIEEDRTMVRRVCEEFDRERTRYFSDVEGQVVKLALAIAGRVLHREAKMDPLLLVAAVRVALDKVKGESETKLRVPMAEVETWAAAFGNETGSSGAGVQIIGDEALQRGECALETSVGTVELGIEAQMLEIEQGFFDLLQRRPA